MKRIVLFIVFSLLIVGCTEPILPKEKRMMTKPIIEEQKNSQPIDDPISMEMGDINSIDAEVTTQDFSNFENDLGSLQW